MQVKHGSYVGNGSAGRGLTGVGFDPDFFLIRRVGNTDLGTVNVYWTHKKMPAGYAVTLRADTAFQTGFIDSLDSDGVTISGNAMVNYNGDTYYYLAIKDNGAGDFAYGLYTGNGGDLKTVFDIPFEPDYFACHSNSAIVGAHYFSTSTSTNKGFQFWGGANRSDLFTASPFRVSNGSADAGNLVNVNATSHAWFAFKNVPGKVKVMEYTGSGADDRNITIGDANLTPVFALIKGDTGQVPIARFKQNSGDQSQQLDNSPVWSNCVQSLGSNTFQVGSDSRVNANTVKYCALFIADDFTYTAPATVLNTADAAAFTDDTTPTLEFTGTDTDGGSDLAYEIQLATANAFSSETPLDQHHWDLYDATHNLYTGVGVNIGSSFIGDGKSLAKAIFYLAAAGSPPGNIVCKLWALTGTHGTNAKPVNGSSPLAVSDSVACSSLGTSALITFTFSGANKVRLTNGMIYGIALYYNQGDGSNRVTYRVDATAPTHAGNRFSSTDGSTWSSSTTVDTCFAVYTDEVIRDKLSSADAGFVNTVNGADTSPFTSAQKISYTVQAGEELAGGTYYWRARAIDPSGFNTWGNWSSPRSFNINISASVTLSAESVTFSDPALTASGRAAVTLSADGIIASDPVLTPKGAAAVTIAADSIILSDPALIASGQATKALTAESVTISDPTVTAKGEAAVALAADSLTLTDPTCTPGGAALTALSAESLTITDPSTTANGAAATALTACALTITDPDVSASGQATTALASETLTITDEVLTAEGSTTADMPTDTITISDPDVTPTGEAATALTADTILLTDPDVSAHGEALANLTAESLTITDGVMEAAAAAAWQMAVEELTISDPAFTATGAGRATLNPESVSISDPALIAMGSAYVTIPGDTVTITDPTFTVFVITSGGIFTALERPMTFTARGRTSVYSAEDRDFGYTAGERNDTFSANERTFVFTNSK